jgi:uncharacterized membrane protein
MLKPLLYSLLWIAVLTLSLFFFVTNVGVYFTGYRSKVFGDSLFHNQLWVALHLIGGTIALFLGPFQFWKWLRNKYASLHRTMGKLYMAGILLIGISALRLSLISYCYPCRVSLFILAVLSLLFTWFAWKAIKTRNIKLHRQMMVRSFICVISFVAVRIDSLLPLDFFFGPIEDGTYRRVVNEYFFSFVPLLIAELIMVWWPQVFIKVKKSL